MRGLSLIYQVKSIVESATATAVVMEVGVIDEIQLGNTIEVDIST
jgi:hypothetical protein